jgi:hypothetical protein
MTNEYCENYYPEQAEKTASQDISRKDLFDLLQRLYLSFSPIIQDFLKRTSNQLSRDLEVGFFEWKGTTETTTAAKKSGNFPAKPEAIALDYEKVLGGKRQKLAAFYSTPAMVQHLASNLFRDYKPGETILDPACGTGVYLLACFDQLAPNSDSIESTLSVLHGVDLDPNVVHITRILLLERALSLNTSIDIERVWHTLCSQIVPGNSLLEPLLAEINGLDFASVFPAPMLKGGFNHIIGNPPYGLSRDSRIDAAELKALKRRYVNWVSGKVNTYMLFMAKGAELLSDGGHLHYVIPNSWLGITSAKTLRKKLTTNFQINLLERFSSRVFPEPGVEAVAVAISKNPTSETGHIRLNLFSAPSGALLESDEMPVLECIRTADRQIPSQWKADTSDVLRQIVNNSIPLSESGLFEPRIALQAYAKGLGTPPQTAEVVRDHPFDALEQIDETYLPYLQGKDISRNCLDWGGSFLSYGPWLAEPQKLEHFTGPRIVLREILGAKPHLFQAAFTEETFLYNKSVLHILPRGVCTTVELKALLEILLSPLGSFVLMHTGRKSQRRLFPKILSADLRDFPIPKDFASFVRSLNEEKNSCVSTTIASHYNLSPTQAALLKIM